MIEMSVSKRPFEWCKEEYYELPVRKSSLTKQSH
jgi:hypothetical protein